MKPVWEPQTMIFVKDCSGVIVVQLQARSATHKSWVVLGLRHLGLGTWPPAILKYRLWAAGLRHLGLGIWLRHLGLGT